jgi:PAS domain S-box-containing protein
MGLITVFNPGAEAIFGYAADEVVGKVTPILWHDSRRDRGGGRGAERSRLSGKPASTRWSPGRAAAAKWMSGK